MPGYSSREQELLTLKSYWSSKHLMCDEAEQNSRLIGALQGWWRMWGRPAVRVWRRWNSVDDWGTLQIFLFFHGLLSLNLFFVSLSLSLSLSHTHTHTLKTLFFHPCGIISRLNHTPCDKLMRTTTLPVRQHLGSKQVLYSSLLQHLCMEGFPESITSEK